MSFFFSQQSAQRSVALETADRLGRRRGLGAPVRRAFLVDPLGHGSTPLGSLMSSGRSKSGGRGGRTRLLLELTALWTAGIDKTESERQRELRELGVDPEEAWADRSGGDIFYTIGPARYWADLVGLPDAAESGARNIRNAKKELQQRQFFKNDTGAKRITVLREDGSGKPYAPPDGRGENSFFRVPEPFWTDGLVSHISGPGLAMFLVFLSVGGNRPGMAMGFHESVIANRFGLSKSTRARGINDLKELGVISEALAGDSREWTPPAQSRLQPGFASVPGYELKKYVLHERFVTAADEARREGTQLW